jgi:hypothetical protein
MPARLRVQAAVHVQARLHTRPRDGALPLQLLLLRRRRRRAGRAVRVARGRWPAQAHASQGRSRGRASGLCRAHAAQRPTRAARAAAGRRGGGSRQCSRVRVHPRRGQRREQTHSACGHVLAPRRYCQRAQQAPASNAKARRQTMQPTGDTAATSRGAVKRVEVWKSGVVLTDKIQITGSYGRRDLRGMTQHANNNNSLSAPRRRIQAPAACGRASPCTARACVRREAGRSRRARGVRAMSSKVPPSPPAPRACA